MAIHQAMATYERRGSSSSASFIGSPESYYHSGQVPQHPQPGEASLLSHRRSSSTWSPRSPQDQAMLGQVQPPYQHIQPFPLPPGVKPANYPSDCKISQALEIARDSEDGESDPQISRILLSGLWFLVQAIRADPEYMMTDTQFSLWNFEQSRFLGGPNDAMWRRATARYWDRAKGDE